MEQDPLTAAKLPLSARPRSSSSPQKEASGPSFKKKKQKKKKRTKQQKEKPKREKTEPSRYVHPYFSIISTLFFFYIPPLSRSLFLSLSVALALSLAVSRTNCVGYYNFHALAPEFGSSETSTYLRRWRKVRLGLKKLFILFSLKEKKSIRFLHFSHTHTQTHASLRSARRLPPRCPVEASCGVVTVGEKLLFVGRLSPHSPGDPEKKKAIPYGCLCFFYSFIYFLSFWILFERFLPLARSLSSPLQYPLFPVTAICADRFAGETRNLALIASSTFMFMRHLCLKAFFPLSSFFFFFFWHI